MNTQAVEGNPAREAHRSILGGICSNINEMHRGTKGIRCAKRAGGSSRAFVSKYEGDITFTGAGSLPMSGTVKKFVKGNYMIVGDAAGMVLPSNGAGITIAMIGGRIAGQVICEHLKDGVSLNEYEKRWKKQMGKVMRNSKVSFKLGSIMFRLPDFMLNMLFNRLTKGIIWRAVTCRRMLWIV